MNNRYIAIEGVIGVGKTTLARLLQPKFQAEILLEVFEENPFLASFYQDRERYAFQTQIFFLLSRYHQQHKAVPGALQRTALITDYTFAKDELFAWLNLKDDELAMYGRVHAALSEKIPRPNLVVYLQADHETIMRRIALRDRPYERDMDPAYIRELAAAYEAWLTNLQDIPVLTIDTSKLDFLARSEDLAYVAEQISGALHRQSPAAVSPGDASLNLLQEKRIGAFQRLHQQLDNGDGRLSDLLSNYVWLSSEVGELAREIGELWRYGNRGAGAGETREASLQGAIDDHRQSLRRELANILAYTLKLANDSGIDLEQAYLDKMQSDMGPA